ncbi:SDR family NAD(P)-dependent oxidoreductase [Halocatena pleomorpha]|uniref:SDR family oxidoreductase n=1 Tax=Halocatena pleomorpha TaxID=1785090 RepID=A0A3P3RKS6_9EURY|nr:SDR family NAD(P)-dependent oxidoreductase [Halocatena pleomorpha]RRJ33460.1 SDR family oxidoreductase [Halocatena pleomorpha]
MSESANEQRVASPTASADEILKIDDYRFTEESVCIVTGAGSGIGRATAIALAGNGMTVVGTDIDESSLAETADRVVALDLDGTFEQVGADLTSDADLKRIVTTAADHGSIRYLANVAGIQHIDPIEAFPMDTYDAMHQIMLRAPLYLSKLCLPHIRSTDDGVGCVGNMCSAHGHYVTADKVAYNITKFGLRGLTQSIAAEGNGTVRSFSVSTGYVKTPLVTDQLSDTADQRGLSVDAVIEDVMLGQARATEMMTPIDVANLFVFGFSKHAAHLNGGDLLFDDGMTLTYE